MGLELALSEKQLSPEEQLEAVDLFRKRMLEYPNPVEYVNNMYGCHPGQDGQDYFEVIFDQQ